MIAKLKSLSFFALSLVACIAFLAGPSRAHAQPGYYGGGQTITCSSDDGKRNYCNADTRGGVQLVRQRSGSACVQGQTWGWDRSGIWVDRGCRADFVTGRGGNGGGGGVGQTLTCSSDDGSRNYCSADTRGGVQMVNQRSGSPCIQGKTWGWDGRGVWVDRGCRAEFLIGRGGGGGGYWGGGGGGDWGGGGGGRGQTFTCSSDNGSRNWCSIPGGGGNVVMSRQISGSPCVQGQTWGLDRKGVWVDRGCRAEFRTAY